MSFTTCPSPSKKPSYSAKTQEEINHQALRENLQTYYMNQQKLRQKQKELEKKKVERTASASSTTSSQGAGTGSNKKVTTIAAVNAGIVALGSIPLQIGRSRSPTPVPDPPVPSPTIHQKKECQGKVRKSLS